MQDEAGALGFDELYSALPEDGRARADAVAAHARSLGETAEKKSGSALTFKLRGKAILKLRIMRGRAVAAFELENEELREYRRESGAHIARKETRVPLTDDAAVESACKLTDMMAASYERDREKAAERRRERRRAARAAAKKAKNYNPNLTYGVYQIFAELNTFTTDEETGEKKPDYPELNGALKSLKQKVKDYYNSEIVPVLFEYEFLK